MDRPQQPAGDGRRRPLPHHGHHRSHLRRTGAAGRHVGRGRQRAGRDGDHVGRRRCVVAELPAWGRGAGVAAVEAADECAGSGGSAGVSGAAGAY